MQKVIKEIQLTGECVSFLISGGFITSISTPTCNSEYSFLNSENHSCNWGSQNTKTGNSLQTYMILQMLLTLTFCVIITIESLACLLKVYTLKTIFSGYRLDYPFNSLNLNISKWWLLDILR